MGPPPERPEASYVSVCVSVSTKLKSCVMYKSLNFTHNLNSKPVMYSYVACVGLRGRGDDGTTSHRYISVSSYRYAITYITYVT